MPFVDANGVQVNFPFEPYPCQVKYMERVVECLKKSVNGILESPTGTGKTLCLLCSTLAWLEDKKAQISSQRWKITAAQKEDIHALDVFKESLVEQLDQAAGQWGGEMAPPKIIYASRTHSQLTQVIQELKRTAYSHFKVCVLGSREQLCIHPQVMKEDNNTTKVHLCRAKVSARSCHFYNNVENAKPNFTNKVMDVEDLVGLGKKHSCCPYYMTRELKNEADIVFLPYNYLLDPKSRRAHGVELNNNIVIFDEAHNLEKICEDSSSFDWSSADMASAIRDLEGLSNKISEMVAAEESGTEMTDNPTSLSEDFTMKDVYDLKMMLHTLEKELDSIVINKPDGVSKPGMFLFELFNKAELNFTTKAYLGDTLDKMVTYLTSESQSTFQSKGAGLSKFADVMKIAFSRDPMSDQPSLSSHQRNLSKAYKVHIKEENKNNNKKKGGWDTGAVSSKPMRVLSYWCFSPGHAMEELRAQGVKSIILTSGTLAPMHSFISEMGIEFPVQLENPHVIEKHQVWIGVVGKGPDGTMLSSSYENRFKPQYQSSLGNAVVNFARVVPNGLLLFFPSYPVMQKSVQHWQENNMWSRVEQYKPIFVEPKGKQDFIFAMENFYEKVNNPTGNGACFAAVCRGKVSEGLDFSDNNGRAVVITGLPFPPRMDPKVILKMQYLEEMKAGGGKGLSGQNWYRQQASRAVNQAIGRVIRHKQDYGAIILCDTRFSSRDSVAQLPSWVRPNLQVHDSFGSALKDMMLFFKNAEKLLPLPKTSKRHSKMGAEVGCQGAYFQPTLTRTMNHISVATLEKSNAVPQHVPSLRDNTASTSSLAKLKIEYEGDSSVAAQPKGLLDALNSASKEHIDLFGAVSDEKSAGAASSSQPALKPRKKIVLKKDMKSSEVSKDSIQTAEQYLVEVKSTLSVESYRLFSRTLANYKKTEDFTSMISCLADIFTDHSSKYHLFRKFYRFVRPHHKEKFDKMCQEILGEGCGYRAKTSISKKRTSSDTLFNQDSTEKKRKEGHDSKLTSKCDAPFDSTQPKPRSSSLQQQLDNKTHLHTEALQSTATSTCQLTFTNNSSTATRNSVSDIATKFTDVNSKRCNSESLFSDISDTHLKNSSTSQCSNLQSSGHLEKKSSSNCVEVPAKRSTVQDGENQVLAGNENEGVPPLVKVGIQSVSCDSRNTVMPKPCTENNQVACENTLKFLRDSSQSGYTCCSCGSEAKIPLKAICLHVCCMECWKTCIRETKECPRCHKKVKRKHLQRICFPASSS